MSMLRTENLTKSFGENIILQNVSVEIEKGEVISIIGPSGTGKSTFLRAVNFLDPPTAGDVYLNDMKISRQNVDIVRRKMGMVFQNFGLFSHMNLMENLCRGPVKLLGKSRAEAEAKAMDLLNTVGLSNRAHHYPHQLSGGQKQRVAIARCLAMEPEIILFDEPTSALDPTMVGEVMAVMRSLSKTGLTMLIVTHEMNFAKEISSRVFYMDERGIYEQGTPKEIFENPQKPKTQEFIYRVRSFNYKLDAVNSDFVAMLVGIDNFCYSHGLEKKTAEKLRLIAEELVLNIIYPKFGACDLSVSFSEQLGRYEVIAKYPGNSENALTSAEDDLARTIILNTAGEVVHTFDDGVNTLRLNIHSVQN